MGKKSNNIAIHLNQNKTWNSSWYLNTAEYFKIFQKDVLTYSYLTSFFNDKRRQYSDLLETRVYRSNNIVIIDLTLITLSFLKRKIITKALSFLISSLKETKHLFIALKKITYLKALTYASFIAIKLAKLIEKGIRFRSKLVKIFLKKVQKNCKGVYVLCTGRINNVDMAKTDRLFIGSVPLQNISLSLEFNLIIANTKKGLQSVKVWVNK
jgi:small subunit ribosomal protein S3